MAGMAGLHTQPRLILVAGPNGAGKSTLTRHLHNARDFLLVDPDAIAKEAGAGAATAGREAIRRINEAIKARKSLIIETTLSGKTLFAHARQAKAAGFRIELHFVGLDNVALSMARIRQRAVLGGHDIPRKDAERRFPRSFANLALMMKQCDFVRLYDNSGTSHVIVTQIRDGVIEYLADGENMPQWARRALREAGFA